MTPSPDTVYYDTFKTPIIAKIVGVHVEGDLNIEKSVRGKSTRTSSAILHEGMYNLLFTFTILEWNIEGK